MSGVAGAVIGLTTGAQPPIGGTTKAVADGTTTSRGCTTNFIGYGFGLTSQEPLPEDLNVTDDTVIRANTGAAEQEPTYTAIAGNTTAKTLSWAVPTP